MMEYWQPVEDTMAVVMLMSTVVIPVNGKTNTPVIIKKTPISHPLVIIEVQCHVIPLNET